MSNVTLPRGMFEFCAVNVDVRNALLMGGRVSKVYSGTKDAYIFNAHQNNFTKIDDMVNDAFKKEFYVEAHNTNEQLPKM